jgi:hypothetical protein
MKYCQAVVPLLNRLKKYVCPVDVYVPEPPSAAAAAGTPINARHRAAAATLTTRKSRRA